MAPLWRAMTLAGAVRCAAWWILDEGLQMTGRMMRIVGLALALAGMSLVAGCGGGGDKPAASENVLRRGTASEPPSLDPHLAQGNSASSIIDDMFVGLMTSDAGGETVYGIAESHTVSDDGLVYTFKLRPGLVWSDGTPLTAQDVVWTFQRLMSPKTGARYAANLFVLKNGRAVNGGAPAETLGVKALDPQTVEFTLERRTPYFLRILNSNATVPLPRHVIEKAGRGWTKPGTIVSNGPFTLTEWVPNTKIAMAKNAKFYDAAAVKLDGVVYYPTDDTGALVKRYRANEVDIILNFPPEQTEFLKKSFGDQVHIATNYGLYYYIFNAAKPPFDNVAVRKALTLAVDKDGIAGQILRGETEPAWSLVPSDISDFKRLPSADAARPLADRQAEARALLAGAGFGPGKPLSFEVRYDSKEESRQIAVALADMWKKVGVETVLKASDFRGITNDARGGKFDVIRYQWFAPYDDPSTFLALVKARSGTNLTGYKNPAIDGMVAAADDQVETPKRMAMLAAAEKKAMEDYPLLPIYFTTARRLVSPRVEGWSDFPGGNVQSRYLSLKPAA
jgi:oligopeptide transport system substrate-binding protein